MFLGIDFGTKNIGLAIANPINRIAFPLCTLKNDNNIFNNINKIIIKNNINKIIIGYPQKKRSTDTKNSQNVILFKNKLELYTNIECILFDENFSTNTTKILINKYDIKKSLKDEISASIILQWYLDSISF